MIWLLLTAQMYISQLRLMRIDAAAMASTVRSDLNACLNSCHLLVSVIIMAKKINDQNIRWAKMSPAGILLSIFQYMGSTPQKQYAPTA